MDGREKQLKTAGILDTKGKLSKVLLADRAKEKEKTINLRKFKGK